MKVALVLLVLVIGWETAWWVAGVGPMLPGKLKALQESGGKEGHLHLIDVRTAREYEWFHIPGAESRPEAFLHPESLSELPRGVPLVFICLSGHRAPIAAYRVKQLGFHRVYYLTWGMLAWILTGGPTVSGKG